VATIAAIPCPLGLAVAGADVGDRAARILPWDIAADLLDDPTLSVVVVDDIPAWHHERILAAIASGDPSAPAVASAPTREGVAGLARRPRRWARTVALSVLAGDLSAACCRAGFALPAPDDALAIARAAAALAERHHGLIAVRARLAAEHPFLGDHAYQAMPGALAERVVLAGRARSSEPRPVVAERRPVADLLGKVARFACRRADTAAAAHAILAGEVEWDARGRLELHPVGGGSHQVGATTVRLGVGGLHSEDSPGIIDGPLTDLDVASYYPSIIHADRISPPGVPDFATSVGTLMARRLVAKRAGDRLASEALKIVVNSLYGQLGNSRSGVWSPPDALRVVLTGQLLLLRLIDGLLDAGCDLISANTDGVVVRGPHRHAADRWRQETGFALEEHVYARLVRTSVNDYVAIGADGAVVKTKGAFAGGDDRRTASRSAAPIIARAAVARLVHGHDPAEVVAASSDALDFTLWRRARDMTWSDQPIAGSVVRWVASRQGRPIVQATNGSVRTVAAAALLVDDPTTLDLTRIDRAWYRDEAERLIAAVVGPAPDAARQLSLFS